MENHSQMPYTFLCRNNDNGQEKHVSNLVELMLTKDPNARIDISRVVELLEFARNYATVRGLDADLIIVDESEFVPKDFWLNTIFPLYMQEKTSLLAATSPQGTNSFQRFMMNIKDPDTGDYLINSIELQEVCRACKTAGKALTCTHKIYAMSSNKSQGKRAAVQAFYEGDDHLAERELLGQTADDSTGLLPPERIQRFLSRRIKLPINPNIACVYLAIDPGGGGPGKMGIVAMVSVHTEYGDGLVVIFVGEVSLEGVLASDRERDAVIDIVKTIRSDTRFDKPIVAIVESAPAISASHIESHLRHAKIDRFCLMSERRGYVEGVPKDAKITFEYIRETQRVLGFGSVSIYENFMSPVGTVPEKELEKLGVMMGNLRAIPRKKNVDYGDQTYVYTAKLGRQADDILVAFMMVLYWRGVFWTSDKYRAFQNIIRNPNINVMR